MVAVGGKLFRSDSNITTKLRKTRGIGEKVTLLKNSCAGALNESEITFEQPGCSNIEVSIKVPSPEVDR